MESIAKCIRTVPVKANPHYWYGNIWFDAPCDVSDMSCHISYIFLVVKSLRQLGSLKTPTTPSSSCEKNTHATHMAKLEFYL